MTWWNMRYNERTVRCPCCQWRQAVHADATRYTCKRCKRAVLVESAAETHEEATPTPD